MMGGEEQSIESAEDAKQEELIELVAGPLTMHFDPAGGMLRHLRLGSVEVLRGVFAAVRDQNWDTIPFSIADLCLNQKPDSFSLTFLARSTDDAIAYEWKGTLSGTPEGTVKYRFDGKALTSFRKNRIGLCVLHPIRECAGQPCEVEHTDGQIVNDKFPHFISPHQPFRDLRAITHALQDGVKAKVTFGGEVFEMEDQRNWTDASYKTYSTPLDLSFPVEVPTGSEVHHEVTIELLHLRTVVDEAMSPQSVADEVTSPQRKGFVASSTTNNAASSSPNQAFAPPDEANAEIRVDFDSAGQRAGLGLGLATTEEQLQESGIENLSRLGLDHLRVDLHLSRDDWKAEADRASALAERIGCPLEIALFTGNTNSSAWQEVQNRFGQSPERVARWLVFHPDAKATPSELVMAAAKSLQNSGTGDRLVVGTNAYFAELNRNRPTVADASAVCYSINPQVHAFDNLSLAETLEAHRWTVDSAVEIFSCPVVVSPITLRPRFNPNATSADAAEPSVPESDPRQPSGFAAAWTLGALSQLLAHKHVSSATFYETHGPRGVMAADGAKYPMYEVFEAIGKSAQVVKCSCSRLLDITAIGVVDSGEQKILLGNMSNRVQQVCVKASTSGDVHQYDVELQPESVQVVSVKAD